MQRLRREYCDSHGLRKTWKTNGVTIDERKSGTGKQAKTGDKLGMRYIGKLKDGKVFDCKLFSPSMTLTDL